MFQEYTEKLYDASHLANAYRERAAQLVYWERISKFLGLGVAPSLILGAILFNNKTAVAVSMIVSGLLSLGIWVWSIGSMAFKLAAIPAYLENPL